jgi:hypothetical protein
VGTLFQHQLSPHGGPDGLILAVLLDEFVGGAVDVEIGGLAE